MKQIILPVLPLKQRFSHFGLSCCGVRCGGVSSMYHTYVVFFVPGPLNCLKRCSRNTGISPVKCPKLFLGVAVTSKKGRALKDWIVIALIHLKRWEAYPPGNYKISRHQKTHFWIDDFPWIGKKWSWSLEFWLHFVANLLFFLDGPNFRNDLNLTNLLGRRFLPFAVWWRCLRPSLGGPKFGVITSSGLGIPMLTLVMGGALLPSLKLTANAPENGWLEYDRFLLGPGLFSGANC